MNHTQNMPPGSRQRLRAEFLWNAELRRKQIADAVKNDQVPNIISAPADQARRKPYNWQLPIRTGSYRILNPMASSSAQLPASMEENSWRPKYMIHMPAERPCFEMPKIKRTANVKLPERRDDIAFCSALPNTSRQKVPQPVFMYHSINETTTEKTEDHPSDTDDDIIVEMVKVADPTERVPESVKEPVKEIKEPRRLPKRPSFLWRMLSGASPNLKYDRIYDVERRRTSKAKKRKADTQSTETN